MKILRVGDPHVTPSNIFECQKLIDFVIKTAKDNQIETIEFLGDLFHTHAIKRVEVEEFWFNNFQKLIENNFKLLILIGNHDVCGSKEKEQTNSLNVFSPLHLQIINKPMIINNIAYIPFTSNIDSFLASSKKLYDMGASKLLVAHQNFSSELFGGYINPDLILQDNIIAGHIHVSDQIGKCFYTGTPKWDDANDANLQKGIWIYKHNPDGSVVSKQFISTENIVTPIYKIVLHEGEATPILKKNARNYLEFHGKTEWIAQMKKLFKGKAHIKGVPIDRKISSINMNETYTLYDYLNAQFSPIDGVSKEEMVDYLKGI